MRQRSNQALSRFPVDILIVAVIVLASSMSFGLGYLTGRGSGAGEPGFWIENVAATSTRSLPAAAAAAKVRAPSIPIAAPGAALVPAEGKYLASKNGSRYYLPSCSGAKRIKEENRVWFSSAEDAQATGRTPASNCPGL